MMNDENTPSGAPPGTILDAATAQEFAANFRGQLKHKAEPETIPARVLSRYAWRRKAAGRTLVGESVR